MTVRARCRRGPGAAAARGAPAWLRGARGFWAGRRAGPAAAGAVGAAGTLWRKG